MMMATELRLYSTPHLSLNAREIVSSELAARCILDCTRNEEGTPKRRLI